MSLVSRIALSAFLLLIGAGIFMWRSRPVSPSPQLPQTVGSPSETKTRTKKISPAFKQVKVQARSPSPLVEQKEIKQVQVIRVPASEAEPDSLEPENLEPENHKPEKKFRPYTRFNAKPRVFFARLDGVDLNSQKTALVFSDLSYGVSLDWTQHWTENFETWGEFHTSRIPMNASESKTIQNQNQSYSGFSLGAGRLFENGFFIGGALDFTQEIFFASQSTTVVKLDRVLVPEITFLVRYPLGVPSEPLGYGVEGSTSALLPSNSGTYQTRLGVSYQGRSYIEQRLNDMDLDLGVFMKRSHYSSEFASQTRLDLGLQFSIRWKIGKNEN